MFLFWFDFYDFFSFYRVQRTGISLYWLQFFNVPTTEVEGLLWYPVISTGSLQGRICTQGDPCNLYRERVCSDTLVFSFLHNFSIYYLRLPEMFGQPGNFNYRVSHGKVKKVIWIWWGYSFWFLLIFWALCVHEKGTFMMNSSVYIFFMLRALPTGYVKMRIISW